MYYHNLRQIKWGLTFGGLIIVLLIAITAITLPVSIKQGISCLHSTIFIIGMVVIFILSIFSSRLISIYLVDEFEVKARKKFGYYLYGTTGGLLILLLCYGWLTNDTVNNMISDFLLGILMPLGVGFIFGQLLSYWSKPDPKI
ncbi:MAG: hypothetical protein WC575_00140 [Patescibacteria group bacterium]